jgi:hypothetical protein
MFQKWKRVFLVSKWISSNEWRNCRYKVRGLQPWNKFSYLDAKLNIFFKPKTLFLSPKWCPSFNHLIMVSQIKMFPLHSPATHSNNQKKTSSSQSKDDWDKDPDWLLENRDHNCEWIKEWKKKIFVEKKRIQERFLGSSSGERKGFAWIEIFFSFQHWSSLKFSLSMDQFKLEFSRELMFKVSKIAPFSTSSMHLLLLPFPPSSQERPR